MIAQSTLLDVNRDEFQAQLPNLTCEEHKLKASHICLAESCISETKYALCVLCKGKHSAGHRLHHISAVFGSQLIQDIQEIVPLQEKIVSDCTASNSELLKKIDDIYNEMMSSMQESFQLFKNSISRNDTLKDLVELKEKFSQLLKQERSEHSSLPSYLQKYGSYYEEFLVMQADLGKSTNFKEEDQSRLLASLSKVSLKFTSSIDEILESSQQNAPTTDMLTQTMNKLGQFDVNRRLKSNGFKLVDSVTNPLHMAAHNLFFF